MIPRKSVFGTVLNFTAVLEMLPGSATTVYYVVKHEGSKCGVRRYVGFGFVSLLMDFNLKFCSPATLASSAHFLHFREHCFILDTQIKNESNDIKLCVLNRRREDSL